jgi:TRAP-type C4-dicarboxylate transport system substrate-binding protein
MGGKKGEETMRSSRFMGVIAGVMFGLFLVSTSQAQQVINIKFADALPPTWPYYQGMKAYKAYVEEKLPNRVKMEIYQPSGGSLP